MIADITAMVTHMPTGCTRAPLTQRCGPCGPYAPLRVRELPLLMNSRMLIDKLLAASKLDPDMLVEMQEDEKYSIWHPR